MSAITRRSVLSSAGAAVAVATVPVGVQAADPEEAQVLALFRQLEDRKRAVTHQWLRIVSDLPMDPRLKRRYGGLPL